VRNDTATIQRWKADCKNEGEFTQEMIVAYAKCIYNNASKNRKKAIAVLIGQGAFFGSVIFAFILIIIMILAFNTGEFTLRSGL
jgi:hypothetical protein